MQARTLLRTLVRIVEDRLMPRSCVFCGTPSVAEENVICCGCQDDLPWTTSGVPSLAEPFDYVVTPLAYEFPIDAAIKAFKFKRRLHYAPAFAEILCNACEQLPGDIDSVLPVPLHWRRKALRGFNQAMELARPVAKRLNAPLVRGVHRKRSTRSQSGLVATERERNLRRAFVCRPTYCYAHTLIVDDVVTTGSTARSLANCLLKSGVRRVSVLALARTTG